jgi:hypothetical protein
VTAREELRALLDSLSEEEAAACVKAVSERRAIAQSWGDPRGQRVTRPGKSKEEQLRFLQELRDAPPTMTEEQWEEVRANLERNRLSSRPLFE